MQDKDQQKFAFINEKIKEKPINKKRMAIQAGFVFAMAILFGLVASFVFTYTQPKLEQMMYPKEDPHISIPQDEPTEETEETETSEPEIDAEGEAEAPSVTVESWEPNLEDYQTLQNQMYAIGREANKFIVTVTGIKSDTDWFNNPYESKGQASGIIIANNGVELLILTEKKVIADAKDVYVTFADEETVQASVKKYDGNTGITVLSVPVSEIKDSTLSAISVAVLGNSLLVTQGTLVIAVGSPLGTNYSILSGNITSTNNTISTIDVNYNVFTTDIIGSSSGSGALINLKGEVIGLVMQDYSSAGDEGTLTAVAISDLKALIEKLSNDQDIPYLGLNVTTVTSYIAQEYDIPKGVYIKKVLMDSPAMAAGLQSGDVITAIDGDAVYSEDGYASKVLSLKPEDTVKVTISRQGNNGYATIVCDVDVSVLK